MTRCMMLVLAAILFVLMCTASWATNPADPTADFRYGTDFLKVAWDGVGTSSECTWLFAQKEVGNKTAIILFSEYDDCGTRLYELGITKQVKAGEGTLEVGAFKDVWHDAADDSGVMLDWTNGRIGFGTVLRENGCSRVAARAKVTSRATLNVAVAEAGAPTRWGIGYSAGKVRLEVAADGDTTWFRASQPVGKFYPELRTRFTKDDSFIGFGLGLAL